MTGSFLAIKALAKAGAAFNCVFGFEEKRLVALLPLALHFVQLLPYVAEPVFQVFGLSSQIA
jgi:hypothetical protein